MEEYSITFYCYKLEEETLSISISRKDNRYLLTEVYKTEYYDPHMSTSLYTKEIPFRYYILMLHYLMYTFTEFYKDNITSAPYPVDKLPPTYYITAIYDLQINEYIIMANNAKIKMKNSIVLYDGIIEDIKSKLNKAAFRLLTIKIEKENIKSLRTLCIVADLIVQFL
jgi:hypothetical protein